MASLALPAGAQTIRRGGALVFLVGSDPSSINPVLSTASEVGDVSAPIYEGLTTVTRGGVVVPLLAKSWTISGDGTVYDFQLVQAQWHDGKPFTSDDVKFSLLNANAKYSAVFSAAGKLIASIETPAPDRVTIHLKHSFGPFLLSLSMATGGAILPKHIFEGTDIPSNPASISTPIGTGPFIFSSWARGDNIRYRRNPNYWQKGKPYLDEVIAKIIVSPEARTEALMAGDVDFITYFFLPPTDYATVKSDSSLRLAPSPVAPSQDNLFFNNTRKPLQDKRVRQALAIATDREYLLRTAFYGIGKVGTAPFTKATAWWSDPGIDFSKTYAFDPKRANQLLDEAGLPRRDGGMRFPLRFVFTTDSAEYTSFAIALKSMWREVGVELTLVAAEATTTAKTVFIDRDFDVAVFPYTSFFDPALGLARIFTTAAIGRPYGNPSGYSNPTVDALFQKAAELTDQAQRGSVYRQVQGILADDLPSLNVHDREPMDGYSNRLHGLQNENHLATWDDEWLSS